MKPRMPSVRGARACAAAGLGWRTVLAPSLVSCAPEKMVMPLHGEVPSDSQTKGMGNGQKQEITQKDKV